MGYAVNFYTRWTAEDFVQHGAYKINRAANAALKDINQQIQHLMLQPQTRDQYAQSLYMLMLALNQFIEKNTAELKQVLALRLHMLQLLHKIREQAAEHPALPAQLQAAGLAMLHSVTQPLPQEMLRSLLIFETCHFLGLASALSSQGRLSVRKVRNVEVYSLLLSLYKKPNIQARYLEQFYQQEHDALMADFQNSKRKILHIHYDKSYLSYAVPRQLALALCGDQPDVCLNEQVLHEIQA